MGPSLLVIHSETLELILNLRYQRAMNHLYKKQQL